MAVGPNGRADEDYRVGFATDRASNIAITTCNKTRNSKDTVLSGVDLSGFPRGTVYFATYKKQKLATSEEYIISEKCLWQGEADHDSNTIKNIKVGASYSDQGNDIGDIIESIPSSMWANNLVGAFLKEHDDTGVHKNVSVTDATKIDLGKNCVFFKTADDTTQPLQWKANQEFQFEVYKTGYYLVHMGFSVNCYKVENKSFSKQFKIDEKLIAEYFYSAVPNDNSFGTTRRALTGTTTFVHLDAGLHKINISGEALGVPDKNVGHYTIAITRML